MVEIPLTYKCNSNCVMCTTVRPSKRKDKKSLDILKKIDSSDDSDTLVFTGGEPTMRHGWFSLFKYINKNYPKKKIKLLTNGRSFKYNKDSKRLSSIKNLELSTEIHGTRLIHDKITCAYGSFNETMMGIKNLLNDGVSVELRIVLHKMNYKNLIEIGKIMKENFKGIRKIIIFPIDLIGLAALNADDLFVSFKEFIPFVEEAVDFLSKDFNVQLYHIPFCKIDKRYHSFIADRTVETMRFTDLKECNGCKYESFCPKVWRTYKGYMDKNQLKESISV